MGVRPTEKVSQFLEKSNDWIHWQTEQNIRVTWDKWEILIKKFQVWIWEKCIRIVGSGNKIDKIYTCQYTYAEDTTNATVVIIYRSRYAQKN